MDTICASDIKDHLSSNMQAAEENRLVLGAEKSGHSRKKVLNCLVVETIKKTQLCIFFNHHNVDRGFVYLSKIPTIRYH